MTYIISWLEKYCYLDFAIPADSDEAHKVRADDDLGQAPPVALDRVYPVLAVDVPDAQLPVVGAGAQAVHADEAEAHDGRAVADERAQFVGGRGVVDVDHAVLRAYRQSLAVEGHGARLQRLKSQKKKKKWSHYHTGNNKNVYLNNKTSKNI